MPPIITNLWFDGNALEAAELYVSVFPNSGITIPITVNGAMPGAGDAAAPVTVDFELDGRPLTGINGGAGFPFTEAVSLLAGGGEPGRCGWLKDRFGLSWQVVAPRLAELLGDPDAQRSRRAFEAMYPMSNVDLAAIEAAVEQP